MEISTRYSRQTAGLEEVLSRFGEAGIDIDALAVRLQDEGAKSFVKSWEELMDCIESKRKVIK